MARNDARGAHEAEYEIITARRRVKQSSVGQADICLRVDLRLHLSASQLVFQPRTEIRRILLRGASGTHEGFARTSIDLARIQADWSGPSAIRITLYVWS